MSSSLKLIPLQESHSAALFALTDSNRAHLKAWLPWLDFVQSENDSLRFIQSALAAEAAGKEMHRFLFLDEEMIGTICLRDLQSEAPNLGYWLSKKHQGQGWMTQAVREMIAWAKDKNYARLALRCQPSNYGSAAVGKKCGFQYQERHQQAENLYGRLVDLDYYALVLN